MPAIITTHNRRASLLHEIALIQNAQSQLDRDGSDSNSSIDYDSPVDNSSAYSSIIGCKLDDRSDRYCSEREYENEQAHLGLGQVHTFDNENSDLLSSEDFNCSIEESNNKDANIFYLHIEDTMVSDTASHNFDNLYHASEQHSSGYSTPGSDGAHSEIVEYLS